MYSSVLYDFDDILIEPTVISNINSRSEVSTRTSDGYLPIMTAPMDTVISKENQEIFKSNGIIPVLPRIPNPELNYTDTETMLSYSLEDFERIFIHNTPS